MLTKALHSLNIQVCRSLGLCGALAEEPATDADITLPCWLRVSLGAVRYLAAFLAARDCDAYVSVVAYADQGVLGGESSRFPQKLWFACCVPPFAVVIWCHFSWLNAWICWSALSLYGFGMSSPG